MVYVAPVSRSTGYQIDPARWNQDVVDNMLAVKATLDESQADALASAHISNTAALQTIFTKTITGGALGANGFLFFETHLNILNNTGVNQTFTLAFTFGGTTLFSFTSAALATSANKYPYNFYLTLANNNSASAQYAYLLAIFVAGALAASTTLSTSMTQNHGWNTAAINTASDANLVMTVQLAAASVNLTADVMADHLRGPYFQS